MPDISKKFAMKTYNKGTEFVYNLNSFEIVECWGIHYNKHESVLEHNQIGRAHVWTPVTIRSRMPSSAWKKKKK